MKKEDIVIYATHSCGFCHALDSWMKDNDIEHEMKMIDTDAEAQKELLEKLDNNFQGVPVTFIKDQMVLGFDRNTITEILRENGVELKNSF